MYSPEFIANALSRVAPLGHESIAAVGRDLGVPYQTIYTWCTRARSRKLAATFAGTGRKNKLAPKQINGVTAATPPVLPSPQPSTPSQCSKPTQWSGKQRLAAVIETAHMDEYDRFTYCTDHGIHPKEIRAWRCAFENYDHDVQERLPPTKAPVVPKAPAAPKAEQHTRTPVSEEPEYITTDELADRIKYDPRTIRTRLMDTVLIENTHYFRPFGGRKLLFHWLRIKEDMLVASREAVIDAITTEDIKTLSQFHKPIKVRVRVRKDNGVIFLNFNYCGVRCREQTGLLGSKENLERTELAATKIERAIQNGTFRYADYFPNSKLVGKFPKGR